MKIESIIRRADGTKVTLDRTNYTFSPADKENPDSPHICDVTDPRHIAALLAITEGYRPADGEEIPEDVVAVSRPKTDTPRPARELSPISLEDEDGEIGRKEAEADRAEYLAQVQREAEERAKSLQDFSDADIAPNPDDQDDGADGGDIEVIEPENGADEAEGGPAEEEAEKADAEEPAEEVGLTEGSLSAMTRDKVVEYFTEFTGVAPQRNATKKAMIAAIMEAIAG